MPASRGGLNRPSYEEFLEILRSIHNGQYGPVRRAAVLRFAADGCGPGETGSSSW
jgi:hypothetical protein